MHEWFPVRTLVAGRLERADLDVVDALDAWSALLLADVAGFTASDDVDRNRVEIIRPW